jgi:hypothetical protein
VATATWQADFHFLLPPQGLPVDYRDRLARILPRGSSWDSEGEIWGTADGDRIDVSLTNGLPTEVFARFDLRAWRPSLYDQFLAFVASIGGRLQSAETGNEVPLTSGAFRRSLAESPAAGFVLDPEGYLRKLKDRPIQLPKKP